MKAAKHTVLLLILAALGSGCASICPKEVITPLSRKNVGITVLSPDNQTIVFTLRSESGSQLYKVNINGTGLVPLTTAPTRDFDPVISPDGTRILYIHNSDGQGNICVMKIDDSDVTCLTSGPGHDFNPVYSSDGSKIYFLHAGVFTHYSPIARPAWHEYDIYSMNANGTDLRRVTHERSYGMGDLSINPQGDALMVSGSGRDIDNLRPVWIIPINNPENKKIVHPNLEKYRRHFLFVPLKVDYSEIRNPRFSPDGTHILFTWPHFEELYTMDLKTNLAERIWTWDFDRKWYSNGKSYPHPIYPRFSHDGRKIIFSTVDEIDINIWCSSDTRWTDIFTKKRDEPILWIINVDGTGLRSVDVK